MTISTVNCFYIEVLICIYVCVIMRNNVAYKGFNVLDYL